MGREATRREMSYHDAAAEVWDLEFTHGTTSAKQAMLAAVEAAVATAHRGFIRGTRDDILEKAEDLDADEDDDLNNDGVASLVWYAMLLDETLPPEQRMENQ